MKRIREPYAICFRKKSSINTNFDLFFNNMNIYFQSYYFLFVCSEAFQRLSWEALKKSINGLINKVNVSNITDITRELIQENIVRGRLELITLFCMNL